MLQLRYVNADKPSLWLVGPLFKIGSQRDTQITLQGTAPLVLELSVADQEVEVTHAEPSVQLNGAKIEVGAKLKNGDKLSFEGYDLEVYDPKNIAKDATKIRQILPDSWYLMGMSPAVLHKRYDVPKPMVMGRSPECDISIPHEQLSRKHAKLSPTPAGMTIEDLKSANGTYVNGKKVQHAVLTHGSEIRLDTIVLKVYGPASKQDDPNVTKLRADDAKAKPLRPAVAKRPHEPVRPTSKPTKPTQPHSPPAEHASKQKAPPTSKSRAVLWFVIGALVLAVGATAIYHFRYGLPI